MTLLIPLGNGYRYAGRGFWFVNVTRSRSDGLSGFVGKIVRGKAQAEARKGLAEALKATKEKLERGQ